VRTNPRQFGAIRNEPGNLCLRETAWWAREDSNYVPITQSLSNRSPAGSKSASVNCRRTPRKDWQSAAKGALLSEIPGAWGALRSCPAGLIAEVGLRWCGARPSSTERRISMSKSAKKRSPAKSASSAPSAEPSRRTAGDAKPENVNSGSKQSRVLAMLQSPAGATIAAVMKATGWQAHSVRGFLAGVVRKRLKLELGSTKVDGNRVYQITKRDAGTTISTRQSKRDAA
jgi:hypothetical protein